MNVVITITNVNLINIFFIASHFVILTISANYVCFADLITLFFLNISTYYIIALLIVS